VTDYFTHEEFEKIIECTYSYPRRPYKFKHATVWGMRLRVLLLLMRWSGLRVSDAVRLETLTPSRRQHPVVPSEDRNTGVLCHCPWRSQRAYAR
jgi:site-specific recombinase XerD